MINSIYKKNVFFIFIIKMLFKFCLSGIHLIQKETNLKNIGNDVNVFIIETNEIQKDVRSDYLKVLISKINI